MLLVSEDPVYCNEHKKLYKHLTITVMLCFINNHIINNIYIHYYLIMYCATNKYRLLSREMHIQKQSGPLSWDLNLCRTFWLLVDALSTELPEPGWEEHFIDNVYYLDNGLTSNQKVRGSNPSWSRLFLDLCLSLYSNTYQPVYSDY